MGHDLSFPFNVVKRAPGATARGRAAEKMVPSIEGEWRRKRRMMSHTWAIVLRGGMLDPRGYPPLYALMIACAPGAALRHAVPAPRGARGERSGWCAAVGSTRAVRAPGRAARRGLAGGGYGRARCSRPLLRADDRVGGPGLADHLRHGTEAGWNSPEGTR